MTTFDDNCDNDDDDDDDSGGGGKPDKDMLAADIYTL